jgi:hypothetical protein
VHQQLGLEGAQPRGHARAHLAEADDADGLAVELAAVDRPVPRAGLERGLGIRDAADKGEDHTEGVLGRRDDVAERCVDDDDAAPRAGVDVDVVDTDPRAPHEPQPRRVLQQLGGDRRARPRDHRVGVGQSPVQHGRRRLLQLFDVELAVAQVVEPLRSDRVHDEHAHAVIPARSNRRLR